MIFPHPTTYGRLIAFLIAVAIACSCGRDATSCPEGTEVVVLTEFPAWSARGAIAFYGSGQNGVPRGLWIRSPDGQATYIGPGDTPSWDPTGRRLIYTGRAGLVIWDSESGATQLLTHGFQAFFPAWSPDGRRIAYDRTTPSDSAGVWTIDLETEGPPVRVTERGFQARCATWSPDGTEMVCSIYKTTWTDLYRVRLRDGHTAFLGGEPRQEDLFARWSPDGTAIAYASHKGIHILTLATGEDEVLPGTKHPCMGTNQACSWSPDSDELVYNREELWVIRRDGTGNRPIKLVWPESRYKSAGP